MGKKVKELFEDYRLVNKLQGEFCELIEEVLFGVPFESGYSPKNVAKETFWDIIKPEMEKDIFDAEEAEKKVLDNIVDGYEKFFGTYFPNDQDCLVDRIGEAIQVIEAFIEKNDGPILKIYDPET